MRVPRLVLLASVILGLGSLVAAPAQADTPTCDGKPATIVGSSDQSELEGTDGDDVIVTNGSRSVQTGGGTDLVCTTDSRISIDVIATGPDVSIDSTGDDMGVVAQLVGGDTFTGSPYADRVDMEDNSAAPNSISTGDGDDELASYWNDQKGTLANPSRIDLGAGDDTAYLARSRPGPPWTAAAGPTSCSCPTSAPSTSSSAGTSTWRDTGSS